MSRPGPANYTANVNRAKTKKWVEAKSYSYDGDDWGDVDDYDEYGGHDEAEPQPASKPTGLRQQGQSATQVPQATYDTRQDLYQPPVDSRQPYANMSGRALQQQQQQQQYGAPRFFSSQSQNPTAITRPKSFDRGDEQRVFSAGDPQRFAPVENRPEPPSQRQDVAAYGLQPNQQFHSYPTEPHPAPIGPPLQAYTHTSVEDQAKYGGQIQLLGGKYREDSYNDQARQPGMGSRTQSMTSNNSGVDFHSRRDFSSSAMPPPLQTRGSPSPHSSDISSSSRPPRKSSLGQNGTPTHPFPGDASSVPTVGGDEEIPSARDRAGSGAGKPLPFVRPAEIYRRMQEEKEKERQSQESSRPSMDGILGGPSDRPNLNRSQDSESSQRLKPVLDPVKERKSEYGIEGVNLQYQETPGERQHTSSKTFEFPRRESKMGSHAAKSSLGPMLPDVSRVSGFGESFFGSTENSGGSFQDSMLDLAGSSPSQPALEPRQSEPEKALQHQPSLGFTSAVHQAFDKAEDQVPPTPSSTQGSSVVRSTSGGTSTVSPIISRGPSTATEHWNSRLPGIDNVSTPMIPEGPEGSSARPISSDSQPTPTRITSAFAPSHDGLPPETEEPPPSFIPGYRRSSDTPSPDNSPRKTPALETNQQLRQPQEIEIAATTPTDPSFSTGNSSRASEMSPEEHLGPEQTVGDVASEGHTAMPITQAAPARSTRHIDTAVPPISPIASPQDRLQNCADSSSSSRVRNLADKFESNSRPGSAHSTTTTTTPRASILGGNAQKKDDLLPPRPLADRMESFRPHLPGGWESSASIAPAATFSTPQAPGVQHQLGQPKSPTTPTSHLSGAVKNLTEGEGTGASNQQPSTVGQLKDASEEAFAAVAAAGSALAGAFGAAVGMEHQDNSPRSVDETSSNEPTSRNKYRTTEPTVSTQGALHPDAPRPHLPAMSDDELSTAAPTPSPQELPKESSAKSIQPDYFPSSSAHRDLESNISLNNGSGLIKQPPALAPLVTDTKPQQYESDRLRKEIVRELTPMSASEPTTAETDPSDYQMTLSATNQSGRHPGHESGVLPREYESYWNEAASDDGMDDFNRDSSPLEGSAAAERQQGPTAIVKPLQPSQGHASTPPVSVPQGEQSRNTSPMLPHRFSWEQPLQDLPPGQGPTHDQPNGPSSNFLKSAIYPDGHLQPRHEYSRSDRTAPSPTEPIGVIHDDSPKAPENGLVGSSDNNISDSARQRVRKDEETPSNFSELEPVSGSSTEHPVESPTDERAQEVKELIDQNPILPNQQRPEPELPQPGLHDKPSLDVPHQYDHLPQTLPSSNTQPKTLAFREILALKSPSERIQAYNQTREQFANINTGLAHWLAATVNDLPEHADLIANPAFALPNVQSHQPSPSRSKLSGLLPTGGHSGQQPHSQRHSHSSTQSPATNSTIPSGSISGGPSPSYAPLGGTSGKLSSQQVQAKGKDLLHTAGVFGGKANVAAKGLFSKGKSKLRAASGNEKASTRQPSGAEPAPQSLHQPPSSQAPIDIQSEHSRPAVQSAPPESQYPSQNMPSKSPRETPSIESFTQSQLGDDERSEESETNKHDHRQRVPNRYSKHDPSTSEKDKTPTKSSTQLGDSAPSSPQHTISANACRGSPKEFGTPRSPSGSSRTPTQATFARHGQPTALPGTPTAIDNALYSEHILGQSGASHREEHDPGRHSSPHSGVSGHLPSNQSAGTATPANRKALDMSSSQKQSSGDSKSTIRNVTNDYDLSEHPTMVQSSTGLQATQDDCLSPVPVGMNALAAAEVNPVIEKANKDGTTQPKSRPSSLTRDSLSVPRPSEDFSLRGPSIDSLPTRTDLERPPSPVSPYLASRRGRSGPIHYGPEHDFVPDSSHERRSRSGSYSRVRPSPDSQRISMHEYPASRSSGDKTPQKYPGRPLRDHSPMLQQQAPEYQVEGPRSPIEWPSEKKSRSRRSSKSSAFFKSMTLGNSPKTDKPLPSNTQDYKVTSSPNNPPIPEKGKSKRASMFRSLPNKSESGSADAQTRENFNSIGPISEPIRSTQSTHPPPPRPPPQLEDDEFPSRGNLRSATSKFSKRLQRSSISGNTEQSSGKKKRFSGLGSLFGRGSPRSQGSSIQVPIRLSNEPSSTQSPQRDFPVISPYVNQRQDWYRPPKDNYTPPPPGGYYAPRPPQASNPALLYDPALPRNGHNTAWDQNTPAYVQDSSLRQSVDQRMTPQGQAEISPPPHQPTTIPFASPQGPTANNPRSSTAHGDSREQSVQPSVSEDKPFGSSWTRFSQHGRSKSRQEQSQPSSNILQQNSSTQPTTHPPLPRTTSSQEYQDPQLHHLPPRSGSPPPPPPPPKDVWNQPRHRESTSRTSTPRQSKHLQSPSQISARSASTQNRQSLPPLRIDIANKGKTGIASIKTVPPEEKRKSRQQEIENSTLTPKSSVKAGTRAVPSRMREEEDEPVVMSATSFPGQEWQPEYAPWNGD